MNSDRDQFLLERYREILTQFERDLDHRTDGGFIPRIEVLKNAVLDLLSATKQSTTISSSPESTLYAESNQDQGPSLEVISQLNRTEIKILKLQVEANKDRACLSVRQLAAITKMPLQTCQDANKRIRSLITRYPTSTPANIGSFNDHLQFGFAALIVVSGRNLSRTAAGKLSADEILDVYRSRPLILARNGAAKELILISDEAMQFPFEKKAEVRRIYGALHQSKAFQQTWSRLIEGDLFPHPDYQASFPLQPLIRGPQWISYLTEAALDFPNPVKYFREQCYSVGRNVTKPTGMLVLDHDKYKNQLEAPPHAVDLSAINDKRMVGLSKIFRLTYEKKIPRRVAITQNTKNLKSGGAIKFIHATAEYELDDKGVPQGLLPDPIKKALLRATKPKTV